MIIYPDNLDHVQTSSVLFPLSSANTTISSSPSSSTKSPSCMDMPKRVDSSAVRPSKSALLSILNQERPGYNDKDNMDAQSLLNFANSTSVPGGFVPISSIVASATPSSRISASSFPHNSSGTSSTTSASRSQSPSHRPLLPAVLRQNFPMQAPSSGSGKPAGSSSSSSSKKSRVSSSSSSSSSSGTSRRGRKASKRTASSSVKEKVKSTVIVPRRKVGRPPSKLRAAAAKGATVTVKTASSPSSSLSSPPRSSSSSSASSPLPQQQDNGHHGNGDSSVTTNTGNGIVYNPSSTGPLQPHPGAAMYPVPMQIYAMPAPAVVPTPGAFAPAGHYGQPYSTAYVLMPFQYARDMNNMVIGLPPSAQLLPPPPPLPPPPMHAALPPAPTMIPMRATVDMANVASPSVPANKMVSMDLAMPPYGNVGKLGEPPMQAPIYYKLPSPVSTAEYPTAASTTTATASSFPRILPSAFEAMQGPAGYMFDERMGELTPSSMVTKQAPQFQPPQPWQQQQQQQQQPLQHLQPPPLQQPQQQRPLLLPQGPMVQQPSSLSPQQQPSLLPHQQQQQSPPSMQLQLPLNFPFEVSNNESIWQQSQQSQQQQQQQQQQHHDQLQRLQQSQQEQQQLPKMPIKPLRPPPWKVRQKQPPEEPKMSRYMLKKQAMEKGGNNNNNNTMRKPRPKTFVSSSPAAAWNPHPSKIFLDASFGMPRSATFSGIPCENGPFESLEILPDPFSCITNNSIKKWTHFDPAIPTHASASASASMPASTPTPVPAPASATLPTPAPVPAPAPTIATATVTSSVAGSVSAEVPATLTSTITNAEIPIAADTATISSFSSSSDQAMQRRCDGIVVPAGVVVPPATVDETAAGMSTPDNAKGGGVRVAVAGSKHGTKPRKIRLIDQTKEVVYWASRQKKTVFP